MEIIKQKKGDGVTRCSLAFFKENYKDVGEIKYIVLYFAEGEWTLKRKYPELFYQYVILIGEKVQLWMSGLTWGYYGEGPYGLYKVMKAIDPTITYEDIVDLEWGIHYHPIVFQNIEKSLLLVPYNDFIVPLLQLGEAPIRWELLRYKEQKLLV